MTKYDDYIARKEQEYGTRFDPSNLAPQFIPYFNSGERIKVSIKGHSQSVFGYVGVTTGWMPTFLLMRTQRSIGSCDVIGKPDKVIAVKRGRTYVNV